MLLPALFAVSAAIVQAADSAPSLIERIRSELRGPATEDSKPHPGIPHGEIIDGVLSDSSVYPGTENPFRVYVPAQYDPSRPACLLLHLDGIGATDPVVLDNLIAKGDIPVMVEVGISSGTVWKAGKREAYRWNRSYEFDSTNGNFPRFILEELLPRVESLRTRDGRPILLSRKASDRAVTGGSTGGIGSFTLAWERPDAFSRVYSVIGTFVSMRGGNDYPALIRKTEPKPIRIFLEDGDSDAWNPLFGSWYDANLNVESALTFSGYDVQHAWGIHGHDGGPGAVIFPDVLRWLWRDWPSEVAPGTSSNDMLKAILAPGEGWERVSGRYASASWVASSPRGDVVFYDRSGNSLDQVGPDGTIRTIAGDLPSLAGIAFGPDGLLHATVPGEGRVVRLDGKGGVHTEADGIRGDRILVEHGGQLVVSEPGLHDDEPGKIWRIGAAGARSLMDTGVYAISGIGFTPDHSLFLAAERRSPRVLSYVASTGGSLADREPFYWLHPADRPGNPGTGDLALDTQGSLYVATPLGIQVCDRNGRVRAILWLPQPSGSVEGLAWGGADFGTLYATDGRTLFRRRMNVLGFPQWGPPVALPPSSAG